MNWVLKNCFFYPYREHAMLAKTAGVKHLVILINKMDDPTVEWEQARYDTQEKDVR